MKVFEFCAIYEPTEKEAEEGAKDQLILEITSVLAKDEGHAQALAARAIPDEWADKLDQVVIAVRPF